MTDVLSVNRVRLRSVESLNLDATVNKIHRRKSNPQAIFFINVEDNTDKLVR
jgi:hypothetical protein